MSLSVGELYATLSVVDTDFNTKLDKAKHEAKGVSRWGKLQATLGLDAKPYHHGLTESQKKWKTFTRTVDPKGFGRSAFMGATLGVAALGAAVGVAAVAGLKYNSMLEQTTISMGVMLGSTAKAKDLVNEVAVMAAKTPFQFPELADATKRLVAYGVAAKDAVPLMTRLGDVSSALGIPIGEMADLYGKMKVSGRISMEDINQMAGRGIPIYSALAKTLGVGEEKIRGMVEKGKIGFPDVEKAFKSMTDKGGMFSGMMDKQSSSFSGIMSTLSDTFTKVAGDAIKPLFEWLTKTGFPALIEAGPRIGAAIMTVGKVVAGIFSTIGKVWNFFNNLPSSAKVFIIAFAAALGTVLVALGALVTILPIVASAMSFAGGPIFMIIKVISLLAAGFVVLWTKCEWFRNFWIGLWDILKGVISAAMPVIKAVLIPLVAAFTAYKVIMLASKAATVAYGIATMAMKIPMLAVTAAQWLWNAAMTANPIGILVVAISALVGVFVLLWMKCGWFRDFWIAVWNIVKAEFALVWPAIKVVIDFIVNGIKWLWDTVSAAVRRFWDWAGPFIKTSVAAWWEGIKINIGLIRGLFERVWPIIVAVVRGAIGTIKTIIDGVKTVIAVIRVVWDAVHKAADFVWGLITKVVRTNIDTIKRVIDGVKDVVKVFAGVWESIKSGVSRVWGGIVSTIGGFVKQIIRIVNYLPGVDIKEVQWGQGGIAGNPHEIPEYAQGVARVNRPTMALIGEDGPEAVLPLSKPGRMKAILSELGLMSSSPITGMTKAGQAPPLFGGIPAFAEGGIVGDIKGFFGGLWGGVTDMFGALKGLISDLRIPSLGIKELAGFLPSILATVWKTVKQQFQDSFGKRPGIVKNATEHIGDPYVWGGRSPGGFDCSGLIYHAYGQAGVGIPRIPVYGGKVIGASQMQAADVLLYSPGAIQEGVSVPFGHYRMYAGGGKTIESGGGGVHMDSLAANPPAQIRTFLGRGGLTNGLAIAGEAGQEAVIPLTNERAMSKLRAGLGTATGGGDSYTFQFTGPVYATSPRQAQASAVRIANEAITRFAAAKRSTNRGTP